MQINKKALTSKSAGFTLIELLIVIIIIGILAAIGFVAYTGSQNKARKSNAEATLSQVRSKLAEYHAEAGNYPANQAAFNTWLASDTGGNNKSLSEKFVAAKGFTYTANDGGTTPGACDNTATPCEAYTAVADGTSFKGDDIEVTN